MLHSIYHDYESYLWRHEKIFLIRLLSTFSVFWLVHISYWPTGSELISKIFDFFNLKTEMRHFSITLIRSIGRHSRKWSTRPGIPDRLVRGPLDQTSLFQNDESPWMFKCMIIAVFTFFQLTMDPITPPSCQRKLWFTCIKTFYGRQVALESI